MDNPPRSLHITTGADLPPLGWASRVPLNPHRVTPVHPDFSFPGKPHGGLWTSPITNPSRWRPATEWTQWCRREARHRRPTRLTVLRATTDARILVVNSDEDMTAIDTAYGRGDPGVPDMPAALSNLLSDVSQWQEATTQRRIDWAAIAEDFDAVQLTEAGIGAGGGIIPRLRWDVPTVWFTRPAFHVVDHYPLPGASRQARTVFGPWRGAR